MHIVFVCHQAPQSMGFSKQEYWSGLPFPSPGLKDELPRSVGAQYATGDQWRNNLRKNEGMVPKQKQHPVVDVIGDGSKVQCCKEQYCIGTWNVRSMNQGKLDMAK